MEIGKTYSVSNLNPEPRWLRCPGGSDAPVAPMLRWLRRCPGGSDGAPVAPTVSPLETPYGAPSGLQGPSGLGVAENCLIIRQPKSFLPSHRR